MSKVKLSSIITCPACSYEKEEQMPTNYCLWFYECDKCHRLLKPLAGDCCVFCSFGTQACPPIQLGDSCCSNSEVKT